MKKQFTEKQVAKVYSSLVDFLNNEGLPNEIWKYVRNTEKRYILSNMGRLVSLYHRSRGSYLRVSLMKPALDGNGYLRTMIKENGKMHTIKMHRLVGQHWVDNPENKPQINHIDHVRTHNEAENLEWVTHRENIDHMMNAGRQTFNNGEKNGLALLTEEKVLEIRAKFKPRRYTRAMLSKEYGVTENCIKDVVIRKSWKHVK